MLYSMEEKINKLLYIRFLTIQTETLLLNVKSKKFYQKMYIYI